MRKICYFLPLLLIATTMAVQAQSIEPADGFIVRDVDYQTVNGSAKLEIETNEHVDYVIYELESPYRIVIDPLDAVWCDYEETIYFDEGLVRSIKFVKGREIPGGPSHPYYPFDFVTVELRSTYPYKFFENDHVVALNIGEALPLRVEPQASLDKAKSIEDELAKEFEGKEAIIKEAETKKQQAEIKIAEAAEAKEKALAEKKILDTARTELTKEKKAINLAKDDLSKEASRLEREKVSLAREKEELARDEDRIKKREEALRKEKMKFEPRPVKDYKDMPPPEDYLNKDLTLDECIQLAISNSMPTRIAKERVRLAKLKVNEAFRELFPEVSFILDETSGRISERPYIGRKVGFEFKQTIFHGGELVYLWEQSKINLKVAEENLNKEKEDLIFDVSKAYYDMAKAINKHKIQKELLEDAKTDFDMVKKEQEFGLISQIDYLNVESSMNQIAHLLVTYENSLSLAKLELNKKMNIDMASEINIVSEFDFKEIDADIQKCMGLALKYRPEYRISYLNTEVAELTEKLAKSQDFPQVDIFGKYLKARELLEPSFESIDNRLKNERVIGATVSVPIGPHTIDYQKKIGKLAPTVTTFESNTKYDLNKFRVNLFDNMGRGTNIQDALITYKEALDELNSAEQNIHTDIRQALFSLTESRIKIENSINNINLYEKELNAARVRKGLNEISFYDFIQAKIKLYSEMSAYAETIGDYYISVCRINKAVGLGGYFN